MTPLRIHFTSHLDAPAAQVWARISTMQGVNEELFPWFRMSFPRGADGLSIEQAPLGTCAFQSWVLALCVIPYDRHALTMISVRPGEGFVEDSTSLLQRRWRHERSVRPLGAEACVLTDDVEIVPRLPWAATLVGRAARAVFRHRHRRLRVRFGGRFAPDT